MKNIWVYIDLKKIPIFASKLQSFPSLTYLWVGKHVQTPRTNLSISRDTNQIVSILCSNNIYTIYRMLKKEILKKVLWNYFHQKDEIIFTVSSQVFCFISKQSHIIRAFLMWSLILFGGLTIDYLKREISF